MRRVANAALQKMYRSGYFPTFGLSSWQRRNMKNVNGSLKNVFARKQMENKPLDLVFLLKHQRGKGVHVQLCSSEFPCHTKLSRLTLELNVAVVFIVSDQSQLVGVNFLRFNLKTVM